MPSIGETLREARMRQRLDITDVEAQTKIRAKYLRALENEDFGMLPGSTFVKSFLRTYAEFLGLDPHLLVEEYRARHDPRDESELTPFARAPKGRQRRRPPRHPAWLPVAAAVLAILALLLVLGLTGGSSNGPSGSATTTNTSAKKATQKKSTTTTTHHAPRRPRTVHLRIVPAEATYVCLDKGGGTRVVYEGTLTGPKSWKARHLRVNLGKRSIRITVNGKHVAVPPGSDPIGYDFRPTHHRELPLGQRPCA
ncbi:MAG TPA: helix-turn-helix domain-containing protein [Thermoleophilaceae bacterium]|nr:helix-turn-helix domain-containing protein [Thermoleophilaceae bacterium]